MLRIHTRFHIEHDGTGRSKGQGHNEESHSRILDRHVSTGKSFVFMLKCVLLLSHAQILDKMAVPGLTDGAGMQAEVSRREIPTLTIKLHPQDRVGGFSRSI